MRIGTQVWRRRITAAVVVGTAAITPIVASNAAGAASLCAPPADTVPPQIASVALSNQTVDVSSGSQTVTVTATATDTSGSGAASGVKRMDAQFRGPSTGAEVKLSLTSGTAVSGTWTGTVTVPATGKDGTWSLDNLYVEDSAHNEQSYSSYGSHPDSPTDVRLQSGWATSFAVTGTTAPPPKAGKPGALTGFSFSPNSVNSTIKARHIQVSATFASPAPIRVGVSFEGSAGQGRRFGRDINLKRGAGNEWMGTLVVHRWVGDVDAKARLFAEYDRSTTRGRNYKNYTAHDLRALEFPSRLAITSGVDKTRPALTSLTITPATVDTKTGKQTLTVSATATDAQSGVKSIDVGVDAIHRFRDVGVATPVSAPFPGGEYVPGGYLNVRLTQQGDNWVGQVTMPRCEPSGTWRVGVQVQDKAGNYKGYSNKKLAKDGLQSTISVTSKHGDVTPPYVNSATAAGAAHMITLDFSEGVKNVTTSTLSVYAVKPASTRFEQPSTVSSITCSNGSADIPCDGITDGLVTSAQLVVPDLSGGTEFTVWSNLGAVTQQLTDGKGNPLSWQYAAASVKGS